MINQSLHKNPTGLDRGQHRNLKLNRQHREMAQFEGLNSFFVACAEFADACKDSPVVWVRAGSDAVGQVMVAPVAVFGVTANQNLAIDNDQWRVRYIPVLLRLYPFALARVSDTQVVLCYDAAWKGFSETEGEALFSAEGEPTPYLDAVRKQLEEVEVEVERTRKVGELLMSKKLLQDMRFEATLPEGKVLSVDGFLTVDEKRLAELADAEVVELHRNGVLGLIHAHQVSMGNMRRLVEWHAQRLAQPAA